MHLDAGRVTVDEEQRKLSAALGVGAGAGDDEQGVGLVGSRDVGLLSTDEVLVTVAVCGGGELMAVGPGVGFGDRERDLRRSRRHRRQPLLLLLVARTPGQQAADYSG